MENSSPHWHYEYEIFFVLRGSLAVNMENGSYRLEQGDIILINPCEIHAMTLAEKGNICLTLQFSPEIISEVYKDPFYFILNTKLDIPQKQYAIFEFRTNLAEMGLLLFEKPGGYPFIMKSLLYKFIGSLFKHTHYQRNKTAETVLSSLDLEEFDRIKQYIKIHFKEELKQDYLCKALGVSRSSLYRLLKTSGSSSTKDLTNYYRIEYAKSLLASTKMSILDIATDSGFESESSFYRVFKTMTGVAPNQYRESPSPKKIALGIQGYVDYPIPEAINLLSAFLVQRSIEEP
jgi:AraC-like DNA-binding protein